MDYKEVKEKILRETDADKALNLIEEFGLQDDEEIKRHFKKINVEDTIEYSLYPRRKKKE